MHPVQGLQNQKRYSLESFQRRNNNRNASRNIHCLSKMSVLISHYLLFLKEHYYINVEGL